MVELHLALKCRLVRGESGDAEATTWRPGSSDISEVLSIRRRQVAIEDVSMYTLQQLLTTLQSLFMDDVLTASGESGEDNDMHGTAPVIGELQGPHVRLLIKSITGDGLQSDLSSRYHYTLLECDKDLQSVLSTLQDDEQLDIDMELIPKGYCYPVLSDGTAVGDTPKDGPFPIDPQGQHVSTPVGGGLVETRLHCDVFVAGGGSAGVGAALAAARSGASVVCVHARPVLGGNSSSEVKLNMVGADMNGGRGVDLETEARESGILEEIRLDNSMMNPQWCPEMWDLTFLDKFRALPNMNLLLNTWFVSCELDQSGSITSVTAESQLTQRRYIVTAEVYIDTTGDGRLGAEAKCEWRQGREAQSEYNESLAMLKADTATEGSSLAFTSRDMGKPAPFKLPPSFNRTFTKEDFVYRKIPAYEYGYWWIERSWPYDNVSDQTQLTTELTEAMLGVWDYIKNSGEFPNVENLALDWFGFYPCKREARRIKGMYIQTQNDIIPTPVAFSDAVCHGGWGLDLHNPKGIDDCLQKPYISTHVPNIYGTPLRCFVSADASNMMMAGRLASFTHVAFGSQRVMATCNVHGQAVGTAAAYAVAHKITPQQLAKDPNAVWSVQQQLLRDDQFVVGQVNQDPRDKALTAVVTATSEQDNGPAKAVISGQTRAVYGKGGCVSGQCLPGSNRWISNGLPATITLMFKEAIASVGQVELVFDTALSKRLTFTMKTAGREETNWGQPFPETVKDYVIEALPASTNSWQTILTIQDNYQRKRVHMIGAEVKCSGIRITVTASNGIPDARICEVRVYEIGNAGKFPVKPSGLQPHPQLSIPSADFEECLQLAVPPEPAWLRDAKPEDRPVA